MLLHQYKKLTGTRLIISLNHRRRNESDDQSLSDEDDVAATGNEKPHQNKMLLTLFRLK